MHHDHLTAFLTRLVIAAWQVIGTPTDDELGFIRNEDARKYMRHLPQFPRRPFASLFPKVQSVAALDLIERMLTFNPLQRITGQSSRRRLAEGLQLAACF